MKVDLIIQARWIIPVEPESVTYENHALVINDGKIVDLLPSINAIQKYQATIIGKTGCTCCYAGFKSIVTLMLVCP